MYITVGIAPVKIYLKKQSISEISPSITFRIYSFLTIKRDYQKELPEMITAIGRSYDLKDPFSFARYITLILDDSFLSHS